MNFYPPCCSLCRGNALECEHFPEPVPDEWDDYEEDGPLDLEDQLENALDRAFPAAKGAQQ